MKFDIEFWTDGCKHIFYEKAEWLKKRGLIDREIKDLLETLYIYVSQEFGG